MRARLLCLAVPILGACTPTLDWREVRPEGSGAQTLFPCKPTVQTRTITLGGAPLRLSMASCHAGGTTFALTFADTADPARVAGVLRSLGEASAANLGATPGPSSPLQVNGMTPNPLAQRIHIEGKGPEGAALAQETGLFSRGTWVYQASVMAPRPDRDAVDTFFDNLRLPG
jgi:hypothetical protein